MTADGLKVLSVSILFLVNLLMDKLIMSLPSRIIVMSTILHHFGHTDFNDLNMERHVLDPYRVYLNKKLTHCVCKRVSQMNSVFFVGDSKCLSSGSRRYRYRSNTLVLELHIVTHCMHCYPRQLVRARTLSYTWLWRRHS